MCCWLWSRWVLVSLSLVYLYIYIYIIFSCDGFFLAVVCVCVLQNRSSSDLILIFHHFIWKKDGFWESTAAILITWLQLSEFGVVSVPRWGLPDGLSRSMIGPVKYDACVARDYWSFFLTVLLLVNFIPCLLMTKWCSPSCRAIPYICRFISDGWARSTCTAVPCSMYIR